MASDHDGAGDEHGGRDLLNFPADDASRPWPLQTLVVTAGAGADRWSEVVRRWRTPDARACGRCPRTLCTFQAGDDGSGVCVVRFGGVVDDPDADDVGLNVVARARPVAPAIPGPSRRRAGVPRGRHAGDAGGAGA